MHRRVWRYLGDVRCPCHGCYGKLSVSGRGDNMIERLTCKVTGKIWMKTPYSHWVEESDFNETEDERHKDLRCIASQLKGGEITT